jgi:hypothetical protein
MRADRLLLVMFAAAFSGPAAAGCGSAFCSVNTDWSTQGAWTEPGGRFDLRYEFIDQDQPRSGTSDVAVGEIPGHHDEVRTINRNWIAAFDYTFNANWSAGIQLPVVSRSHSHLHNHMGAVLPESWSFVEVGDASVAGRYRFGQAGPQMGGFGVQLGVKLPTGQYDVANDAGDLAERSLQPGTGTVDAIAGLFYSGSVSEDASWFAETLWTAPLNERENYRPGDRVGVNIGGAYAIGNTISFLLQLNTVWEDRDTGAEAEPEDTGGTFVHLSPGVSARLGQRSQVYAFVQLPVYQHVNGVQLVADWAISAGLSRRF